MKVTHVLGHNSNWNIESYNEQEVGDYFLITAYTHGINYDHNKHITQIINHSMIDLQFYGKKESGNIKGGKLDQFKFHPANSSKNDLTSVYFENCVKQAISFQKSKGFKNIIIPHYYENEDIDQITSLIHSISKYVSNIREDNEQYYMSLPLANHVIISKDKVEEILLTCTDMEINFDGYFISCEMKPEFRKKLDTDIKIFTNLSKVFKNLKINGFKTIFAYANWDAIIYLAQTDIDYITIGTYENLRRFDINRYTEDQSGGGSKGYYFSEKLLNMVRADDIVRIRNTDNLDIIKNDRNIFSDIILQDGYKWNIHRPDVNKNYLLSIDKLLKQISSITNIDKRKEFVLELVDNAIQNYRELDRKRVFLDDISSNYHLNDWKTYLANS
ncbi:MAG: hypothetical protein JJ971_02150 [Balneolaceae bacterium]|nr:hypothetical protein [Balneolaceae bacterium]MBO6545174.1 hypothetical protein [Balneolaceae bacterium]MBO6646570.1 hypothetical protein [Balneolaceae bacterium]